MASHRMLFVTLLLVPRKGFSGRIRGAALLLVAVIGAGRLAAQSVSSFDLFELQLYNQTNCAQPTAPDNYNFNARIFTSDPLSCATATLTIPCVYSPATMVQSGAVFQYGGSYGKIDQLNAAFPQGDYNFTVNSSSLNPASQSATLTLPASFYSASVPYFTNYSDLQHLDASADATFNWNTFCPNGSAESSATFLVIWDSTQNSTVFDGFMEGGSTSYTAAGGTLVAGDSYTATLYFSSRNAVPNAWEDGTADGLIGFDQVTSMDFSVSAIPEPSTTALLAGLGAIGWVIARRVVERRRAVVRA